MSKSQIFTSSLPIDMSQKIEQYASKHKIPKNKVIEKALEMLFNEEKRKSFIEGVKKWGMDPENLEWAEMGMKDYSEQLKDLDA